MDKREELIRGLSQSFQMDMGSRGAAEQRYNNDTNTLLGNEVKGRTTEEIHFRGIERHDEVVEKETFQRIATGRQNFLVVEKKNQHVGDTMLIREMENFKVTGGVLLKEINAILSDTKGLKENYQIVIFQ